MITPDKLQQIKTAYSWLRPSPIFDLVEAVEELQEKNQELLKSAQDTYGIIQYLFCHYYPQDGELEEAMNELGAAIDKVTEQEKQ